MLQLFDPAAGTYVPVTPSRPGVLRVCAHDGTGEGRSGAAALRVLLTADVLTRMSEWRGLQAFTAFARESRRSGTGSAGLPGSRTIGVKPPTVHTTCLEARQDLGGPIDVHVVSRGTSREPWAGGFPVIVGPVHGADPAAAFTGDPLAVRLALLRARYHEPADLSASALADAERTLTAWREAVAVWAESPSAPVPDLMRQALREALSRLDTASVLTALGEAADQPDLRPGLRFEAYVLADRVLGLELARDVGRD